MAQFAPHPSKTLYLIEGITEVEMYEDTLDNHPKYHRNMQVMRHPRRGEPEDFLETTVQKALQELGPSSKLEDAKEALRKRWIGSGKIYAAQTRLFRPSKPQYPHPQKP